MLPVSTPTTMPLPMYNAPAPHESCRSELVRFPWRSRPECVYMLVDVGKDPIGSLLCLSVLHGLHLLPALESSLSDNHRISGTRNPSNADVRDGVLLYVWILLLL